MRDDGVSDAVDWLLHADPDVADRAEIGAMIRRANQIHGWVDAAKIRFARRLRELEAQGRSEAPAMALTDDGRRSGREAKATEHRERICSQIPALEDALAVGAVSSDHLDVLARLTRNLTDSERSDLHFVADDLVASATTDYVSEFERKTRNLIDHIRTTHAPHDDAAELDRQRDTSNIKRWIDKPTGMHKTLVELDPIRDATLHAAIDAHLARLRQRADHAHTPFAQLQIESLLAAISTEQPGERRVPEITLVIDNTSLCDGRHVDTICETSDGAPLPVSAVQRMCCEATIVPVIIGDRGQALAVGREHRTASRAQRRALRAMYRSCAHPHCTVGFDHCRIHHITWWSDNGPTDIDNLLPVCETHHHLVHEGRWSISMAPDRACTWRRPDGTIGYSGAGNNRTKREHPPNLPSGDRAVSAHRQPSLC